MTVLIAGAGIGGLTLGLSLHQLGIPFRIFEAVEDLQPLGVGINVQPQAIRELYALGLEADLDGVGLRTKEVAYFNRQGQEVWAEPRGQAAGYTWPQISAHRGKLQMALFHALVARAGADVVRTGASVGNWEPSDAGVRVQLSNRQSGQDIGAVDGSVLIACDGINSGLRAGLYPDEGPAHWGGTMMWRGVSHSAKVRTGASIVMIGTRACKWVGYPIADTETGSVINWIADLAMPADYKWRTQDWNRAGRAEDLLPHFAAWDLGWINIPEIIRSADNIYEFPMVDRNPLDQWTFGPVTLLGDAAHAMYPIGSNGASQAIVDARVLARELRNHGAGPQALHAYEDIRREAVNKVVLANRGDGPDRILEIMAERAPDGFSDLETVMPLAERQELANHYKSVAGMDIATLNATPPLIAD